MEFACSQSLACGARKNTGHPGCALLTDLIQVCAAVDIEEVKSIPGPYDLQVWVENEHLCSEDIAGVRLAVAVGSTLSGIGHQHFAGSFHRNVAVRQTADLVVKLGNGAAGHPIRARHLSKLLVNPVRVGLQRDVPGQIDFLQDVVVQIGVGGN